MTGARLRTSLVTLMVCHFACPASAQERTPPLWELGGVAFGVSQQAYPGAAERVNRGLALPYFIYRGRSCRGK
jgi:MipA family protein